MMDPELLTLPTSALTPRSAVTLPILSRFTMPALMPEPSIDAISPVLVTVTLVPKIALDTLVIVPLFVTLAARSARMALLAPPSAPMVPEAKLDTLTFLPDTPNT
ncbi:hypothetical protein XI07_28260 [Bradyrhizobium sp. CCBAU 11445]|nr:hypothetical protein [Bradyrhizobium sp. CCBAU 11445]